MLHEKIRTYTAKIGVIGLGYVGLPLAVLAGLKGYQVVGIDHDREKVANLREGKSYITDITDIDLKTLTDKRVIEASTDSRMLAFCDVIVVCVPTPLDRESKPDYSLLIRAAEDIAAVLQKGQLVIVESTVAPGTTESVVLPRLSSGGLAAGTDYFLAYSPERIDPGNKLYGVSNIPKLVAGLTTDSQACACSFYEALGLSVVPVHNMAAAEMAKLLENTYRDVNIALINEMAQICRANGMDIWDVIRAAATKPFGFQAFYPGPGVGGHCVPVDSVYYAFWARAGGTPALLAEHARKINADMPQYIAEMIQETLKAVGKDVRDSKILVLGVTYKKDINDVRESAAMELLKLLQLEGANVSFHDPNVERINVNSATIMRAPLDESSVTSQDCVVLAVAHSTYELSWLVSVSPVLIDLTNALKEFEDQKIVKL